MLMHIRVNLVNLVQLTVSSTYLICTTYIMIIEYKIQNAMDQWPIGESMGVKYAIQDFMSFFV